MRLGVYLFATTVLLGNYGNLISPAKAQTEPIKVGLSIVQDGGVSGYGLRTRTSLKIPPETNPISQLHIAPQRSGRLQVSPPTQNVRITQPKDKKKLVKSTTPPAAPLPVKSLIAPAPNPVPIKKVTKALAVTVPRLVPRPLSLKKSGKPVASLTSTPATEKLAPAVPPLPPKLAAASKSTEPSGQVSKQNQAVKISPGQIIQIKFDKTATKLPKNMKDTLRKLADGVRDKKELWLRLMAYANAEDMTASKARRLSLSRALSVRSFLIENGVKSTRIGVMALGNKSSKAPKNRVDISISKR
jgi:outer membrane protein OmpA-like peptidoglycan-associated protein